MYKVDPKDIMFWEDMTREEAREKLAGNNPPGWHIGLDVKTREDGYTEGRFRAHMSDEIVRAKQMVKIASNDGHEMNDWTWGYDKAWCTCKKCNKTMWLLKSADTDDEGNPVETMEVVGIDNKCE